ncbi:hypothetical protein [Candidatus Burkholderia verschuerenii]|nr:hypothetical protein [Candidatus Burkholderia verschuerenii]
MKDFLDIDIDGITLERAQVAGAPGVRVNAPREPQELAASDSIDIYHWAAVALVTAFMCAVLGYAAGTPALARAANVTSMVFGVADGMLTAGGLIRGLRARLANNGVLRRMSRVSRAS